MSYTFNPIAISHSCYKEKFATPRQSGLVSSAKAIIELLEPYNHPDSIDGLDGFSHLWLIYIFHQNADKGFQNKVRPPRLAGEKKGVYATRSPFRPNPLGISVVKLEKIELRKKKVLLHISGQDLIDQTPVIDIKPYVSYSDAITDAKSGFIDDLQEADFTIRFTDHVEQEILSVQKNHPEIRNFIVQLLSQDPRPYFTKSIKNEYAVNIYEYNLRWQIHGHQIIVTDLSNIYS